MNAVARLYRAACGVAASVAVSIVALAPAMAQEQASPPPAGHKQIQPTVLKTFDGWQVRCYPVAMQAPCDMWEAIAFKKGGQLAVSLSIVYVPSQDRYVMQFIVPLEIDLAKGMQIVAGKYTSKPYPYLHCERIGCFAAVTEAKEAMQAAQGASTMKVRVVLFRGKPLDLEVPLKGFEEARAAMVEAAKQKASNPPAASSGG